jgi:uncharacterized membrane protein (DUF2068 family)
MRDELLDVMWAIVLIQGAITLLSFLEALVVGASQGVALVPILTLTGAGAVLALTSARGLRRRRRWARRVTLVAESLVLFAGATNFIATLVLAQRIGLVSVLTTIVAPIAVLVLLRKTRDLFRTGSRLEEAADVLV